MVGGARWKCRNIYGKWLHGKHSSDIISLLSESQLDMNNSTMAIIFAFKAIVGGDFGHDKKKDFFSQKLVINLVSHIFQVIHILCLFINCGLYDPKLSKS